MSSRIRANPSRTCAKLRECRIRRMRRESANASREPHCAGPCGAIPARNVPSHSTHSGSGHWLDSAQ
eukprot:3059994-Prymnesium_polylepis.1